MLIRGTFPSCFTAALGSYTTPVGWRHWKPDMDDTYHRRKTRLLWALIVVAAVYSLWFDQRQTLTGNHMVDGTVTVLLGLYICSRPAGNAIDLLFFERNFLRRGASGWSIIKWLALNILTLVAGWIVIYLGTTHLIGRAD
jgi:hypothetical protein